MVTTSPSGNRNVTSVPPGRVSDPASRSGGLEPPVQFVDPVREDGQLVGALDRLGGVPVVTDHASVILHLDLEAVVALPQPGQLGGEVIACRFRQPR